MWEFIFVEAFVIHMVFDASGANSGSLSLAHTSQVPAMVENTLPSGIVLDFSLQQPSNDNRNNGYVADLRLHMQVGILGL